MSFIEPTATLNTHDAAFNIGVNVCITKRDKKTGKASGNCADGKR